jgi:hypothetical protein
MVGLYQVFLVEMFIMYACGFVFYMLVSSGLAAIASHYLKDPYLDGRPRLNFAINFSAAFVACVAPPLITLFLRRQPSISLPLVVAVVALYMDYRRLREGVIEIEELWADLAGFAFGITVVGAWAVAAQHLGWTQFRI